MYRNPLGQEPTGRIISLAGRRRRSAVGRAQSEACELVREVRLLLGDLDHGTVSLDDFSFELFRLGAAIGGLAARRELVG